MKRNAGIIALAAAGALVLSGCAADTTDEADNPSDDGVVSEDNTGDSPDAGGNDEVTEPAGLPAESLRIAPGEYQYSYEFLNDYSGASGALISGVMIIEAGGACEFDMDILNLGELPPAGSEDGEIIRPTLRGGKTSTDFSAMIYPPEELNEEAFTVPELRTVFDMDSEFWNTFVENDPYMGIGMNNSISKYHGPCFMNQLPELLDDHSLADDLLGEGEEGGYVFNADKIAEYEEERLAETAEAIFSTQENASALAEAWVAEQNRFAPRLSDEEEIFITEIEPMQSEDGTAVRFNSMTEDVAMGSFEIWPLEVDNEFPTEIFIPEADSSFGLGDYGVSIEDQLLAE
jgi:hypothetical protein